MVREEKTDTWKEGGLRTYVMGRNEATGGKCCKPLLRGGAEWGLQGAQRLFGSRARGSLLLQDCVFLLPARCPAFRAARPVLSHCSVPCSTAWFQNPLL